MEGRVEFLRKLQDLVALAQKQENRITIEEVKRFFSESDLTEEQMELVFDYLLAQKVVVKGYIKMTEQEAQEETVFTEEEKVYLEDYMADLQTFKQPDKQEREKLFSLVLQGDVQAKKRLTEGYLAEVVEIAKAMYHPGIFLGDLIQEGNVGLIMGVEMISDLESAHETIIGQVRGSIHMLIEEQDELSNRDKKMVEKVRLMDESITALTEELGRKVTIDELAVHMGMTVEEVDDILRLTGEEEEEEEHLSDDFS